MLEIDVDKVYSGIKQAVSLARSEEDLKIRVSGILESEVLSKLEDIPIAEYEYTFISGGRADALYGHVIIEYKAPGKLSTNRDISKAKEQVIRYIKKEAEVEERYKMFLGVIISDRIAFVRYDPRTKNWILRGPYDINKQTVIRLIEAIRGLRRKKLSVDELLRDFGPSSDVAKLSVKVFYNKIVNPKSKKTEVLFEDWKRVFSQVCAYDPEKLKGLEKEYGLKGVDSTKLLFAIHTYYALIMKILAAEIAYLFGTGKFLKSYVSEIESSHLEGLDSLKDTLKELESGGVFRTLLGIKNFLEGDYFSWYLEEFDEDIANAISLIAKRLADYEPATPILEPEYARDLLKRLYQHLVPKTIRHDLGEYYTPDWLAELVLDEVGWTVENFERIAKEKDDPTAPLQLRLLDPACGSGTFLILAIKRLREYADEHYLTDILGSYILENIVGYDLNPLAVLATRTNYLLAIADILPRAEIEIPVYLADSLLIETKSSLVGSSYIIRTSAGVFEIPKKIVDMGKLGKLLDLISKKLKQNYSLEEFVKLVDIRSELDIDDENVIEEVIKLYSKFYELEKEGKDSIWTSIIRNAFAPLFKGKFDFVVGNPPWIMWDNLPKEYREASLKLWSIYGLLTEKVLGKKMIRYGGVKKDLSILFTYVCLDKYLKDNGTFAFLITQAVFKTKAGAVFRRFKAKDTPIKVLKVHDLTDVKPFEGANNKTTMVIMKKGEQTKYPVEYIVWKPLVRIDVSMPLEEVLLKTKRFKMIALPSNPGDIFSPWITIPSVVQSVIKKVHGVCHYEPIAGIYSGGTNAVYWLKILDVVEEKKVSIDVPAHLQKIFGNKITKIKYILIENITKGMKKKVKNVKAIIEDFFVYPMIKDAHLKKWRIDSWIYTLQMQDPVKRVGYDEVWVGKNFPKTYEYLRSFKDILLNRAAYKKYMKGKAFYSMHNVSIETFAPFKVVWNRMGSELKACVISKVNDKFLCDKLLLPENVLAFIGVDNEDEAHYICAIMNSSIVNFILKSIAGGGKNFGTPELVRKTVAIEKFDPKNPIHKKLAELSKKAHELAKESNEEKLREIEDEIDKTVAKLYGITDEELKDILAILRGEDIEKEEPEEEPKDVQVNFNTNVKPSLGGNLEISIINPQKQKITIELDLFGKTEKLETDKEEETFNVKIKPLNPGEYEIPYKVIVNGKLKEEGSFKLFVEKERKLRKKDQLDNMLDELLG